MYKNQIFPVGLASSFSPEQYMPVGCNLMCTDFYHSLDDGGPGQVWVGFRAVGQTEDAGCRHRRTQKPVGKHNSNELL